MVPDSGQPSHAAVFQTTHWSVVLQAQAPGSSDAHAALARLCQAYWYPLYCCVRRYGHSPQDAEDLTQAFFAKLLEKGQISFADPERGRFRTFLLRSLENFLRNEHARAITQKRGGNREIVSLDSETAEARYAAELDSQAMPEQVFEKRWASTTLAGALARLRREFSSSGRVDLFDLLEPHLWGDDTRTPYGEVATELGMTVAAIKVTMHRLRHRYREVLREEIAQTLEKAEDIESELQHLRRVLTGP